MFCWAEKWEKWRIPDEKIGAAYAQSSPQQRARVKATLSLVESVYGVADTDLIERRVQRKKYGFGYVQRSIPVPWVLFVLDTQKCSPVQIAAAVMPAHLAGVNDLATLCVNGRNDPLPKEHCSHNDAQLEANLLNALEISGIEDCFALPSDSSLDMALDELEKAFDDPKNFLDGRILFLGFDSLPIKEQKDRPSIWYDHHDQKNGSSLILSPDLHDLCFYPDLSPQFFHNLEMKIFSLANNNF